MTHKKSFFYSLFTGLALLMFGSVQGQACPGYYITMSQDDSKVYATGIIYQGDPGEGLQVTLNLTNPNNSASSNEDSGENFWDYSVAVHADLLIGIEDGAYTATTQNYKVIPGFPAIWLAQVQETRTVSPWVQASTSTIQNPSMSKVNGTNHFNVVVMTSRNCSGNVTISAHLGPPPMMLIEIQSGDLSWGPSAEKLISMSAGSNANFGYSIRTNPGNSATGTVQVVGAIFAHPIACTTKGPESGSGQSLQRSFTVN